MSVVSNRITLHGTMLSVFGLGLLITGDPGIGKTRFAIMLLNQGCQLISDDATDIYVNSFGLLARCPPAIYNQLWLNGYGLVDVQQTWGVRALQAEQRLDLIVHLDNENDQPVTTQLIFDILIPKITAKRFTYVVPWLVRGIQGRFLEPADDPANKSWERNVDQM